MTGKEKAQFIKESFDEMAFMDGFDDAILGVAERSGSSPVIAYDYEKCIEVLLQSSTMTDDEAREYFEFNCLGAYIGELTPVVITTLT